MYMFPRVRLVRAAYLRPTASVISDLLAQFLVLCMLFFVDWRHEDPLLRARKKTLDIHARICCDRLWHLSINTFFIHIEIECRGWLLEHLTSQWSTKQQYWMRNGGPINWATLVAQPHVPPITLHSPCYANIDLKQQQAPLNQLKSCTSKFRRLSAASPVTQADGKRVSPRIKRGQNTCWTGQLGMT